MVGPKGRQIRLVVIGWGGEAKESEERRGREGKMESPPASVFPGVRRSASPPAAPPAASHLAPSFTPQALHSHSSALNI